MALDVLGTGFDQFPSELRDEIVARYPREHFKEGYVEALFGGFAHSPAPRTAPRSSVSLNALSPVIRAPTSAT